jgi:hypothetical protein
MDDKKFYVAGGDPNFNGDHNKRVIAEVMRKHEETRQRKIKEFNEELAERADAAEMYLLHVSNKGTPIEKYFGRRELAHLQGKKIIQKLVEIKGKQYLKLDSI